MKLFREPRPKYYTNELTIYLLIEVVVGSWNNCKFLVRSENDWQAGDERLTV